MILCKCDKCGKEHEAEQALPLPMTMLSIFGHKQPEPPKERYAIYLRDGEKIRTINLCEGCEGLLDMFIFGRGED